jgi:hypothetical protein
MRHMISVFLVLLMVARLAPAAPDTASITAQITSIPLGATIEVRLTDKQKLRGTRGALSTTGFALAKPNAGERQIAFADVASVKQTTIKPHTTRNVLIGVGIGLAAAVIVIAVLASNAKY